MKNLLKLGIQLTNKQQQEITGGNAGPSTVGLDGPSTCESRCDENCKFDPIDSGKCAKECKELC